MIDDMNSSMRMPNDFPPWPSLVAFRVAARRKSFRDAALDLRVTPSAISHQIKRLETAVGGPLFERRVRQVQLTVLGQSLAEGLERGFAFVCQWLAHSPTALVRETPSRAFDCD